MGERICSVEGCGRRALARWLCGRHYQQAHKTGSLPPIVPRLCGIEGCTGRHIARGWCKRHYTRWLRNGDPIVRRQRPAAECSVRGCTRTAVTRGWCGRHYQRWYKTGDPLGLRLGRWDEYERPGCIVDGCARPAHARGLCSIHGPRQRRHGNPAAGRRLNTVGTDEERYLSLIDRRGPDECWPWLAGKTTAGYGQIRIDGEQVYAHRWGYEHFVGPIPEGLTIDHTCHNADAACPGGACEHRACQNWERHLEPVTSGENVRRGLARRR